jgi:hypothetical protein
VDDLIRAFMQTINYQVWLKGGASGKGLDLTGLKLKATIQTGDPKLIAHDMRSFPGIMNLKTRSCHLKVGLLEKDEHGDKDVLYECDGRMDMSYWMDMEDIFFEYSLKIHENS